MGESDLWQPRESRGRYFALAYLVLLSGVVVQLATTDRSLSWAVGGGAGLAAFVATYVRLFMLHHLMRGRSPEVHREACWCVAVLLALTIALPLVFGDLFVGLVIYSSVAMAIVVPFRRVVPAVVALAAVNAVIMVIVGSGSDEFLTMTLVALLSPFSVVAMRRLIMINDELRSAREENARLAVSEERLRFARDLHDLLGHSLSLIALKSQLAGRLVERDPEQVAGELRDIESVARQALVEVRATVSGYRRSLAEELAGAASALRAAQIDVELPRPGAPLPATVESLLGWAVREATTNILRHSHAAHVSMMIGRGASEARLTVRDDGAGPRQHDPEHIDVGGGHGLRGLAERMAAAGGTLHAGAAPGGGFELVVSVPLDAAAVSAAPLPPSPDHRTVPAVLPERDRRTSARPI